MYKNFYHCLIAIIVICTIAACGGSGTPVKETSETTEQSNESIANAETTETAEANVETNTLGIWEVKYFVDDFGEPTKDGYIMTELKGTFSNDHAQDNPKLWVRFIIESPEIIDIKLYEYDSNSPKVLHAETSYKVLVKDSEGEVHTLKAYHDHDRMSFSAAESKKLHDILLTGGTLKFNIVGSNSFSPRSAEYNFTIDNADGFENAVIKLEGE